MRPSVIARLLLLAAAAARTSALSLGIPRSPLRVSNGVSQPLQRRQTGQVQLQQDFPDPCILQGDNGTWYAFATNGGGKRIQAARAEDPLGPWTYVSGHDALPQANWTTGRDTWAPDVRRGPDGSYVMYFAGEAPERDGRHCIGVARSSRSQGILGPYVADDTPWACHFEYGGAIDASGFTDGDGKRYVVYKIDGNRHGNGGECDNTVEPRVDTPLVLQEVEEDGVTKVGKPRTILRRADEDGPLIEAPNLVRFGGLYVLFYSSQCFTSREYDVKYATASKVEGPYERAGRALLRTGDFGLEAPGGATSVVDGDEEGGRMLFHGRCYEGMCLYAARFKVERGRLHIVD